MNLLRSGAPQTDTSGGASLVRRALAAAALACAPLVGACASGKVAAPPPPPSAAARPAPPIPAPLGDSPLPKPTNDAPPASPSAAPAASAPATGPVTGAAAHPGEGPAESKDDGAKATPQATSAAAADAPEARARAPLGWIAGEALAPEELLLEWADFAPRDFYGVTDKLVTARLALAEAARLSIRLAPEEVEARVTAERAELGERLKKRGAEGDLEQAIERELGFEAARYLDRVRRATIRQMVAERAVRANSLSNETLALRMIVVSTAETMAAVQAALARGREFADVASEFSVDDSKKNGGLVAFVVPQERSPLARLAFQTPVGQCAGPLEWADHQFLIQVEERRAPMEGDWPVIGQEVERSLREHPIVDAEFLHWKLVMEERYPIDLGPLWSLVGTAR